MSGRRAILWFRNDLRIHDNEALSEAMKSADELLPVYVFDSRTFFEKTSFGFAKTGSYRGRFIIESVAALRKALRERYGIDLIVRVGKPEEVIFDLARKLRSGWVFCNRERTREEVNVQDRLEQNLWSIGQEIRYSRGKMLYYTADLPFPVTHCPDIFSQFRKEVENFVQVRKPLPAPGAIPGIPLRIPPGEIPSMSDFGWKEPDVDSRSVLPFRGGEEAGLRRLHDYIWKTKSIATYKKTRNGLLGADYSSKFSPWLAHGCLSPKTIYWEVKKFEERFGANKSTYWLIFELLWRDFFRLMGKKHGKLIFLPGGIKRETDPEWTTDWSIFTTWARGRTGFPFIDANMRELNATGFMSNRGRQNVASFLVNDLRISWLPGAEYFESLLIDYDPCSNYGNWNYIAGVGSDPKSDRYFHAVNQARRYDPDGEYIKKWVPELGPLDPDDIYHPWSIPDATLGEAGIQLGRDYPLPVADLAVNT